MNYKNSIVFVGGIHGCGKTTISQHIAVLLGAAHVTASELIRAAGSVKPSFRTDVDKKVTQADINQALLLRSLHDYRASCDSAVILLDGHFSLLDHLGAVTRIPVEVYEAIAPIAMLLIEADAGIIQERLTKRDGGALSLETISLLANHERRQADEVTTRLRIPLCTVRGDGQLRENAQIAAENLRAMLGGPA